jgi:hypothetical protein
MALVGDIIMGLREAATDLPVRQLPAPGTELTVASSVVASTTLPAGGYFVKLAYQNPWGETLPSATEFGPITVDATHGILISAPTLNSIPPAVTAILAYFAIGVGVENQFIAISLASLPFTITAPGTTGFPRGVSTAYLPDSDGSLVSAFAAYRWLNDGLKEACGKCGGGLPDMSGVASVAGQGLYQLQGSWWKANQAWYDGYPMSISASTSIFRKNPITGNYAMAFVVGQVQDRVVIEMWPQPARTSGQATLNTAITGIQTGTFLVTPGASSFVLTFGLAKIGSEIVYYSAMPGGSISVVMRGMGGTIPGPWPAGTLVQELNVFFYGMRTAPIYSVGQASLTFNLPPGWEPALAHYLLHRYRLTERDPAAAKDEYGQFSQIIGSFPLNKPVGGPRQIQVGGARGVETYPGLGSVFGGVIVP